MELLVGREHLTYYNQDIFAKTAVDLVIEKHQPSGEITSIRVDSVANGNLCWRNLEDIGGDSEQT